MALRNLVTRMRVPAATALRRPRLSPARPLSAAPQGTQGVETNLLQKALDRKALESATDDELLSMAQALSEEYTRASMGPLREVNQQIDDLVNEAFSLTKKIVCTGVGICLLGSASAYWGRKHPL